VSSPSPTWVTHFAMTRRCLHLPAMSITSF
jgi:hypothetical protein